MAMPFPRLTHRWITAVVLLGSLWPGDGAAQSRVTTAPTHVRPTNARLAAALREGLVFSRTMRDLVAVLEAVPVIVYLHDGGCGGSAESCLIMGANAGGHRFVHVNFRMTDGRRTRYLDFFDRLVAQIAHELQHAVEVSRDASIVDGATLAAAYDRIGQRSRAGHAVVFETEDALRAGRAVLREWAGRFRN